jgi:hypothetical protein
VISNSALTLEGGLHHRMGDGTQYPQQTRPYSTMYLLTSDPQSKNYERVEKQRNPVPVSDGGDMEQEESVVRAGQDGSGDDSGLEQDADEEPGPDSDQSPPHNEEEGAGQGGNSSASSGDEDNPEHNQGSGDEGGQGSGDEDEQGSEDEDEHHDPETGDSDSSSESEGEDTDTDGSDKAEAAAPIPSLLRQFPGETIENVDVRSETGTLSHQGALGSVQAADMNTSDLTDGGREQGARAQAEQDEPVQGLCEQRLPAAAEGHDESEVEGDDSSGSDSSYYRPAGGSRCSPSVLIVDCTREMSIRPVPLFVEVDTPAPMDLAPMVASAATQTTSQSLAWSGPEQSDAEANSESN